MSIQCNKCGEDMLYTFDGFGYDEYGETEEMIRNYKCNNCNNRITLSEFETLYTNLLKRVNIAISVLGEHKDI